jgi:hypothetical protein
MRFGIVGLGDGANLVVAPLRRDIRLWATTAASARSCWRRGQLLVIDRRTAFRPIHGSFIYVPYGEPTEDARRMRPALAAALARRRQLPLG